MWKLLLSLCLLSYVPTFGDDNKSPQTRSISSLFAEKRPLYEIKENYDLGGKTVSLPKDAVIDFRGGRITNGVLRCNNNVFEGRAGISSDVSLEGSVVGPLNVQVFELLSGVRSFDIGRILNTAGAVCKNLIVPEGIFYFQTPIRLESIRFYQQYADMFYNGNIKEGAVLQFYGGNASFIQIIGKLHYDTNSKTIDYSRLNRTDIVGIEFVNINNSYAYVGDVEYFNNNIRVSGYGAGNSYNKYVIGISSFSNEHLRIYQEDMLPKKRGWCNENMFFGGRFCNWSHWDWDRWESLAICIEGPVSGDSYNGANSLLFIKPCMEGFKDYAVYAKNVTGCHWQDARTEGCGAFVKFVGVCKDNIVSSSYGTEQMDYSQSTTYPVKISDLFPIFNVKHGGSSPMTISLKTDRAKVFKVVFGDELAKARVGVVYIRSATDKPISRAVGKTMIKPRTPVHPESFYFNNSSEMWMLASDSSKSEFVIPDDVSEIQLVFSGVFDTATIYSNCLTSIVSN